MIAELNYIGGIKRKASRRDMELKEALQQLAEIDKKAEERYEEREHKRMLAFLEAEERRDRAYAEQQESQRRHEERMQYMFMSLIQQMLPRGGHGHPPGPQYPLSTPHQAGYPPPVSPSTSPFPPQVSLTPVSDNFD